MSDSHLSFDEISELAESGRESAHVAGCESCRMTLLRVRQLIGDARALPSEVPPPPEVWSVVRARAPLAGAGAARASRWWHRGWLATAAAIVLVLGTATFTLLLSRGRPTKAKAMITNPTPVSPVLFAVDKNYVVTIRELRAALAAQRASLAPSTVQTVERSLKVIDDAIAEARAALAADPANQALVDILASHYERQVDLLQRATELSSSL
jgi:hypothetical protein